MQMVGVEIVRTILTNLSLTIKENYIQIICIEIVAVNLDKFTVNN